MSAATLFGKGNNITTDSNSLDQVMQSSPDAMLLLSESGELLAANPAAEIFFGRPCSDLGAAIPPFCHVPDRLQEIHVLTPLGDLATGEMYTAMISWHGRKVVLVSIRDVTEARKTEASLRDKYRQLETANRQLVEMQARLVQKERLHALGEMASGIAHDFNNTLMTVLGMSELLLTERGMRSDPKRVKAAAKEIHAAASDASAIVSRLRDFHRQPDDAWFSMVDVNQTIQQAVDMARPKWQTQALAVGIAITPKLNLGELPQVRGNISELRQAFVNILTNAVDAMPRGGAISLSSRCEGKEVRIDIQDSGLGMSEAVLKRCIEPFYSTKGSQGTGMGLATVHGTVKRHAGSMTIDSTEGSGTTVTIRLPIR